MQKIKLLKKTYLGNKGEVVEVTNNIAHGLIEAGAGKLYRGRNKMMTPRRKKGYSIK